MKKYFTVTSGGYLGIFEDSPSISLASRYADRGCGKWTKTLEEAEKIFGGKALRNLYDAHGRPIASPQQAPLPNGRVTRARHGVEDKMDGLRKAYFDSQPKTEIHLGTGLAAAKNAAHISLLAFRSDKKGNTAKEQLTRASTLFESKLKAACFALTFAKAEVNAGNSVVIYLPRQAINAILGRGEDLRTAGWPSKRCSKIKHVDLIKCANDCFHEIRDYCLVQPQDRKHVITVMLERLAAKRLSE